MVGAFRARNNGKFVHESHQEGLPTTAIMSNEGVVAVQEFSLNIKNKKFIVLVSSSGCGKSTALRMVAGLEDITGGELYMGDRLVNDVPPKDRDIAMMFQNYAR